MPTVKQGESRKDYVSRCVSVVMREDSTKSQAYAVAKCRGMWEQAQKKRAVQNRTQIVPRNPLKADPTRTVTLRRAFEREFRKRFYLLRQKILRLVVDEDAFGLRHQTFLSFSENKEQDSARDDTSGSSSPSDTEPCGDGNRSTRVGGGLTRKNDGKTAIQSKPAEMVVQEASVLESDALFHGKVTLNQRWAFRTDPEKVKAFNAWLATQVQADIVTTTAEAAENAYWQQYVQQGYKKGAGRAFDDTRAPVRAAMDAASREQMGFYEGTRAEFLRSSFARPVAVEKVKLLAGRVFTDLTGVTTAMSTAITRELTDGLVQGQNPRVIARRMNKAIDGIGRRRAEMIARTEIIRAHAEGQLDAFENLGVEEVGIAAEWSTAGDDRVCPLCQPLEGVVMKVKEARGILPRHVNCRCTWIPANVGEDHKGQKRGRGAIEEAKGQSIKAEIPKRSKRTIAQQKSRSRWAGADKTIAKKRPRSVLEPPKKVTPKKAIARTPLSTSDPRSGESPSDYMDRMLGKVGSQERKLASDTTYQHYLQRWDAFQKKTKPKPKPKAVKVVKKKVPPKVKPRARPPKERVTPRTAGKPKPVPRVVRPKPTPETTKERVLRALEEGGEQSLAAIETRAGVGSFDELFDALIELASEKRVVGTRGGWKLAGKAKPKPKVVKIAKKKVSPKPKPARRVTAKKPATAKDPLTFDRVTTTRTGFSQERAQRELEQTLGRRVSKEEVGNLAGATDKAKINVSRGRGAGEIDFMTEGKGYDAITVLQTEKEVLYIDRVFVEEAAQGRGLGTEIVGRIVGQAKKMGYTVKLEAAAGLASDGTVMNGYYTWARLGFDGPLPRGWLRQAQSQGLKGVPSSVKKAKKVSDLMKTKRGRQIWKDFGTSVDLSMPTTSGSAELRVLEQYLAKKRGL